MSTIKLRVKRVEGKTLVRILIEHPMDTGRKQDSASGALVPAHFIQSLQLTHNGRLVADCELSTAVSRDPYLSFRLRDAKPGERVQLAWKDNFGLSDSAEVRVPDTHEVPD